MKIGQVARQAHVNIETIRYYERRGLIPEPPRRDSGYRQYDEDTVRRIRFIRRSKDLGFSLREISELLSLRRDPATSCADIKRRAGDKIADIDGRIRSLETMKKALARLERECRGRGPVSQCPILEALEAEEQSTGSFGEP